MQRRTFLQTLFGVAATASLGSLHAKNRARKIVLLESPLAGYQYHRAEGVWPFLRVGEALQLVREPGNPYDPNAIAIYFKNDRLGYVPRKENRALAVMLERGEQMQAHVIRLANDPDPWQRLRFRVSLLV
jgi:hypothetical protein